MDYEKLHKDTIAKLQEMVNSGKITVETACGICADFVPKSEDDRVREAIIKCLKWLQNEARWTDVYGISFDSIFAWFKKQGKKETDEWKEGNVIRYGGILALVIKGRRAMKSNGELFTVQYPNEWVKAAPNEIEHFLNEFEKQGEQNPVVIIPKFKIGDNIKTANEEPLTITKIDDKGYWSEDLFICGFEDITRWELVEQKPAETVKWSPQEESFICQLESLVKEQWRQAEKVHDSVNIKKMSELMFFLKTLNPNKKPQRIISAEVKEAMYDKPAWSEWDRILQDSSISYLCNLRDTFETKGWDKEQIQKCISWLQSLRPQNTWKPSDEQMFDLKCAADSNTDVLLGQSLLSLYIDLKKLREG